MEEEMKIPKGYKQTEVGVIPNDWAVYDFGDLISSTQLGGNYPNSEINNGVPLIKMGNLGRGKIILNKLEFIPSETSPSNRDELQYGDVIFNTRNTLELVGKVAIWRNEMPKAYFNSNIMRFNFNSKKVKSNFYMNYVLNTRNSIMQLKDIATGTTSVAAIYSKDLFKIKIPLPPTRTEQIAIATALSDMDSLIEGLEKLLVKKLNIKQGAMQELLKPKEGWVEKKLGEIGKCIRGVSYNGDIDLYEYDNVNSIRLMRSNNIHEATLNFDSLQYVNQNRVKPIQIMQDFDILICMANGSKRLVGKTAQFFKNNNNRYTFGAFMGCFRVFSGEVKRSLVFYFLQTSTYRQFIEILLSGSSINNLKPSDIESIKFHIPTDIIEQERILLILSNMDTEIAQLETQLSKYKMLKTGMMQELLTGKKRLI